MSDPVQLFKPQPMTPMDAGEAVMVLPAQGQDEEIRERVPVVLNVVDLNRLTVNVEQHEASHAWQPRHALQVQIS